MNLLLFESSHFLRLFIVHGSYFSFAIELFSNMQYYRIYSKFTSLFTNPLKVINSITINYFLSFLWHYPSHCVRDNVFEGKLRSYVLLKHDSIQILALFKILNYYRYDAKDKSSIHSDNTTNIKILCYLNGGCRKLF